MDPRDWLLISMIEHTLEINGWWWMAVAKSGKNFGFVGSDAVCKFELELALHRPEGRGRERALCPRENGQSLILELSAVFLDQLGGNGMEVGRRRGKRWGCNFSSFLLPLILESSCWRSW